MSKSGRFVGIKYKTEDVEPMEKWAKQNKLPLGWVIRRCAEIGWPTFVKNPFQERKAQ